MVRHDAFGEKLAPDVAFVGIASEEHDSVPLNIKPLFCNYLCVFVIACFLDRDAVVNNGIGGVVDVLQQRGPNYRQQVASVKAALEKLDGRVVLHARRENVILSSEPDSEWFSNSAVIKSMLLRQKHLICGRWFVLAMSKPLPCQTTRRHAFNPVSWNVFRVRVDCGLVMVDPSQIATVPAVDWLELILASADPSVLELHTKNAVNRKIHNNQTVGAKHVIIERFISKIPADQFRVWQEFVRDLTAEKPVVICSVKDDGGFRVHRIVFVNLVVDNDTLMRSVNNYFCDFTIGLAGFGVRSPSINSSARN